MSRDALLEEIETSQLRGEIPHFNVGDTIKVHIRIIEGDKERIQVFTGTVIARKGSGLSETFSMYRVAYGAGMERVFSLHSPRIAKIEVVRSGKVRRAKLYYLRGAAGKAAKVKEKIGARKGKKGPALVEDAPPPQKEESPQVEEKKPEDETPKSE
ncbi:MAG: 50S ribosomal protein L19 [Chlamydiia bacterium]|nr:50S ribosomal protein L19 [Chlamydiia bacterium]